MIDDRLICIAYREADMAPMLVYRHIEGELFARQIPVFSFAEACRMYGKPAQADVGLVQGLCFVHVKSRGVYRAFVELVRNEAEPTGLPFILYQNVNNRVVFLRPGDEFHDGRFRLLEEA